MRNGTNEPPHDKTNNVAVRPAKTQISLGIRPVIRVFAVRMKKAWVLSYPLSARRRLWSDWADAQANLSLRSAHSYFVGFVMRRIKSYLSTISQHRVIVCINTPWTFLLFFGSTWIHDAVWPDYMSHVMKKPVLSYANNKGADQPAHLRSLISAFVVRCLDSIMPLLAIYKQSRL